MNESLGESHRNLLTSAEEISDIIRSAPNKRSTGTDQMPYLLMKHFSPNILLFLTILFNHLLARAYFSVAWKHSLVTPIPKAGRDMAFAMNWRPISSLNCVSKIFERVLAARITVQINTLDIFHNKYGFLRGHSSVHALGRLRGQMKIKINGHLLPHSTSVKLLGVIMDRNNRSVRHIDYVLKKARGVFFR